MSEKQLETIFHPIRLKCRFHKQCCFNRVNRMWSSIWDSVQWEPTQKFFYF